MILFGTQELNFYVGDIALYTLMAANNNNEKIKELLEFKQIKREIIIAENILKLLECYINNSDSNQLFNFYNATRNNITLNPLSSMLINFIGNIYCELGTSYLNTFSNIGNTFKSQYRYLKYKYALISLALKKNASEDENKIVRIILNTILEDIETSIAEGCKKIFDDHTINDKNKYAKGLIFIGNIFKKSEFNIDNSSKFLKKIINPKE